MTTKKLIDTLNKYEKFTNKKITVHGFEVSKVFIDGDLNIYSKDLNDQIEEYKRIIHQQDLDIDDLEVATSYESKSKNDCDS